MINYIDKNDDQNLNMYVWKQEDLTSFLDEFLIYLTIESRIQDRNNNIPYTYFGKKEDIIDIRDLDIYVIEKKWERNRNIILKLYRSINKKKLNDN